MIVVLSTIIWPNFALPNKHIPNTLVVKSLFQSGGNGLVQVQPQWKPLMKTSINLRPPVTLDKIICTETVMHIWGIFSSGTELTIQ